MHERLELLVAEEDGRTVLRAPEVGWFTCGLGPGALVGGGQTAGVLDTLGRTVELIVPRGVAGRVVGERPERIHEPVSWGRVLYELAPLEGVVAEALPAEEEESSSGGTVFRAPHSGRFWHRPTPQDPPFAAAGDEVSVGQTVGLIEVMKTFTHLAYSAEGELPACARIVRVLAGDGAEVDEGSPIFEVEPI